MSFGTFRRARISGTRKARIYGTDMNNWLAGGSLIATVLLVFLLAGCDRLNAALGTFVNVEECRGFSLR